MLTLFAPLAAFVALDFPVAPVLLGFVLGPMVEENFRRALLLSRGDLAIFVEHPISATFLALSALLVVAQIVWGWRASRRARLSARNDATERRPGNRSAPSGNGRSGLTMEVIRHGAGVSPPAGDGRRHQHRRSASASVGERVWSAGSECPAVDPHGCASSTLSCVAVSKSSASWRSRSCPDSSPLVLLTMRPRLTAGRASSMSAQR